MGPNTKGTESVRTAFPEEFRAAIERTGMEPETAAKFLDSVFVEIRAVMDQHEEVKVTFDHFEIIKNQKR